MKKSKWLPWIIVGAIVLVLVFTAIGSYNRLVSADTATDNKLAQIDVQLERRADLIPNLVGTVKGYTAHEEKVLAEIANARAKLSGAGTPAEKATADQQLSGALSRLLVVVENYPNLKADVQFTRLMDELAGTENRLSVARQDYNNAVTDYNSRIRRFPVSIYAAMFGFDKKELFRAKEGAGTAPEVKF